MSHKVSVTIGGQELVFETGKMAKQANGSVFGRIGESAVLATVCCSGQAEEGLDFVPLSVDYNEKYYAAGKIPGGFLKREGRPKDKEILVSRMIDRPMRPLFQKEFGREIQVVPTTVSTDQVNPPDIIGMNSAFAAVYISDIPFNGPVGAVRVASIKGELKVNPSFDEVDNSDLDIIVAGGLNGITMVEGGAKEVSEELLLSAIEIAEADIKKICKAQEELRELAGKEKLPLAPGKPPLSIETDVRAFAYDKLKEACFVKGKDERRQAIKAVKEEAKNQFEDKIEEEEAPLFSSLFDTMEKEILRKSILENKLRTDGRGPEDIRPISCEIDLLPRTHGSALFTRGETQALAVLTLGSSLDEQILDNIEGDTREHFMLHYNFPPFSVGETGRLGTGRREIGHGHLAHRALQAVLPEKDSFPYTLRVVSEVLESNGSSSMATVCGGSLSMLNAGVPVKNPVAGIAMGLVAEGDNYVVLSDILGEEDHLGDMDFKVAGTEKGITAFQMDIKIDGVTRDIMTNALNQAKKGRAHILGIMNETIAVPRDNISDFAPRIFTMKVPEDKIGAIIGPGGKNIKALCEKTNSKIDIDDSGKLQIFTRDKADGEKATEMIKALIEEPEVGRIYDGVVKRIVDFGAFVEYLPGNEGLCHISKLSRKRVASVDSVLEEGQQIPVKLIEIDKMGRANLSYVDALEERQKGDE